MTHTIGGGDAARRYSMTAERVLWAVVGLLIEIDEGVHRLIAWMRGLADDLRRRGT